MVSSPQIGGCLLVDPTLDARWDALVGRHPHGSVFHLSGWKPVLEESFGHKGYYLAIEDEDGQLVAGLPVYLVGRRLTGRRLIAMPHGDSCCPLIRELGQLNVLLEAAQEVATDCGAKYVEIRTRQCCPHCHLDDRVYQRVLTYKNHAIPLYGDWAQVESRFHRGARGNTRRARRNGLQFRRGGSEGDLATFYQLYTETRRRCGLPPQPRSFFQGLHRSFAPSCPLTVDLVLDGDQVVAAMLGVIHKSTFYALYEGWATAAVAKRPGHLLIAEEIRLAHEADLTQFDLGRTSSANAGLMRFKESWGAAEFDLAYFRYPALESDGLSQVKERQPRYLRQVVRHVPTPVLRWAGQVLYKYLG